MTTISALPAAGALSGTETIPLVQGGITKQGAIGALVEAVAQPFVDTAATSASNAAVSEANAAVQAVTRSRQAIKEQFGDLTQLFNVDFTGPDPMANNVYADDGNILSYRLVGASGQVYKIAGAANVGGTHDFAVTHFIPVKAGGYLISTIGSANSSYYDKDFTFVCAGSAITANVAEAVPGGMTQDGYVRFEVQTEAADSFQYLRQLYVSGSDAAQQGFRVFGEGPRKHQGKVAYAWGDSQTHLAYWQVEFKRQTGLVLDWSGVVGRTLLTSATTIMTTDVSGLDFFIDLHGVNDYRADVPLGTVNDDDSDATFAGGIYKIIKRVVDQNTVGEAMKTRIILVGPTPHGFNGAGAVYYPPNANGLGLYVEDYNDMKRAMAERLGVPYLDLFDVGGLNELTIPLKMVGPKNPADTARDWLHWGEGPGKMGWDVASLLAGMVECA